MPPDFVGIGRPDNDSASGVRATGVYNASVWELKWGPSQTIKRCAAVSVRCTNLAGTLGSLIAGLLSAALPLFIIGGPHLTSAQETKQSHEVAKTTGNAKLIARGKYIVE